MPIWTIEDYWKVIERLESAKGSKKQYADIVRETGVSSLSTCSASPAFSHPSFFPLDPFHLFYENCMPHLWDIWVSYSSESEIVHMPKNIASALGEAAESAIATLPPSFSGPIRDPSKKRQSSYKIYEWMALLHWYIVPIAWELGFNKEVVKNFAIFSNVVEYAMTAIPRTQKDLIKLYTKIVDFLQGFEHLYVGNDISKIPRCRLCLFQLIFVPFHISYHGSIRFGSQATCERAIGDIGHGIRSKKSPFKNINTYTTDKQSVRILQLIYPTLSTSDEAKVERTSLFKQIPITHKQRAENDDVKAHLKAIQDYLRVGSENVPQIVQWEKCPLSNNVTLASQVFELSKKTTCTLRYFEAHLSQGTQPKDQSMDETELEVEETKPIFGEALAFYTVAETDLSLVVYHPLIEHHKLHGRWFGKWSSSIYVLETSAIVSLIGIWTYNNHVHILRRHPGLTLLRSDECGINSEDSKE